MYGLFLENLCELREKWIPLVYHKNIKIEKLKIYRTIPATNPMIAHLPIALAFIGVFSLKTMYRINPTRGKRNDKIFRPAD